MDHQFNNQQQKKVAITEFISQGAHIPAITKYLYSDFIVNQIDRNEQLVYLKKKPHHSENIGQEAPFDFTLSNQLLSEIKQTLGQDAAQGIQKLYVQLQCAEKITPWECIISKELSKTQRKALHDFVREKLYQIQSTTSQNGQIRLRFNKKLRKMNPNARHKYTYFKLYKYGIDTFNAIFRLSKATGINNKLFSTAGLKDKRGFTTQMVSVYNTDLPSLLRFYKQSDRNRQMWIDEFQECKQNKIEVGGLFGNQFGLILRMLNPNDDSLIMKSVQSLREIGFINYFGLQRFGQFSIKTYELGALVLRQEWKQLVESILLSDCGDAQVNKLKREYYENKQYQEGENSLYNKYKIEKLIFKGLQKQGQNFRGVFENLPRSIRSLYTHALQSYIWNQIVSRRIRQHGLKLIINDLVAIKSVKTTKNVEGNIAEGQDYLQAGEEGLDDEEVEIGLITHDNINQFSIYDLVAPLYGPSTIIQKQAIVYKYIQDELQSLQLNDEDFTKNSKLLCFKGQYRRMIVKPKMVQSKIVRHKYAKDQLLSPFYTIGQHIDYQSGQLSALELILQLPKSSYATMAIRELLHISSEFQVQMELNREYERKYVKQ